MWILTVQPSVASAHIDSYDTILYQIYRRPEEKGVIVKRGAIVDARITGSPCRPFGRKEYG